MGQTDAGTQTAPNLSVSEQQWNESRTVMLRAERGDQLEITQVVEALTNGRKVPASVTVQERIQRYYGPTLVATELSSEQYFRITAPGPDSNLLLWRSVQSNTGDASWCRAAEITARFMNERPTYDICQECGEPIKTYEHARQALFDLCSV